MKCVSINQLVVLTISAIVLLSSTPRSEAKVFDRCEFVRTLRQYGFPEYQIPVWTCIVNFESHFDTNALNTQTGDHGIFQISQIYWCTINGGPGGGCHARCSDFHDDNIADDARCVRIIYDEHQRLSGNGFNAWTTYPRYCKGDTSSWINGC